MLQKWKGALSSAAQIKSQSISRIRCIQDAADTKNKKYDDFKLFGFEQLSVIILVSCFIATIGLNDVFLDERIRFDSESGRVVG